MDRYATLKVNHEGPPEWIGWADGVSEPEKVINDPSLGNGTDFFVRDFLLRKIVASTTGLPN
jgi:hypothetical protein